MDWKEEERKEIELLNEMYVNAVIQRVRKNPDLLAFVWQSPAICEAAIWEDPSAIRHVKNPEELVKHVIQENPSAIGIIEAPSKSLCLCAVEIDPEVIHSINWDHPSLQDREDRLDVYVAAARAERENPPTSGYHVFESRPEPSGIDWNLAEEAETVASHMEMIDIDPHSITEIEHPSKRVCLYALAADPSVVSEIRLDNLDWEDRLEVIGAIGAMDDVLAARRNGFLSVPDDGIDYDLASEIRNHDDGIKDEVESFISDDRKYARPGMRM